jgi:hypothetical protein
MALVAINCYALDVVPLMICVLLHIDYYIPLLDVTLIIRCMLWGMCHMLTERHIRATVKIRLYVFLKKWVVTVRVILAIAVHFNWSIRN